ncbi:INO80/SWR1 chromatin remodeling helicase [Abortiporus biennis]
MSTRSRSSQPSASVNGKEGMNGGNGSAATTEGRLVQERDMLIHEKQVAVKQTLDAHDSMVRELFHMEKFVTMISYNPEIAKNDTSEVFQEFKAARYDLLAKTENAGPSRRTRNARRERTEVLNTPVLPLSAPLPSKRGKRKPKQGEPNVYWSIQAQSKSKGKRKESADTLSNALSSNGTNEDMDLETPESISTGLIYPSKNRNKGKMKATESAEDLDDNPSYSTSAHPALRSRRNGGSIPLPAPKRRKLDSPSLSLMGPPLYIPPPSNISTPPTWSRTRKSQQTTIETASSSSSLANNTQVPPSAKTPLRRVKLIVRRPPATYSNPRQKPPQPTHGESLTSLLSSYTLSLDGEDVDAERLDKEALEHAKFLEHVNNLEHQGLLYYTPGQPADSARTTPTIPDEYERKLGAWDHIVREIKGRNRIRIVTGQEVAKQVAHRIARYWSSQRKEESKLMAAREKRQKVLAKKTLREVLSAWGKAVLHIRAELQRELEEEERKRGHEHLDDILLNAGKLLQAQKSGLLRSESLSSSRASSFAPSGGFQDSDDEGFEEEEEGVEDDDRTDTASEDEEGDITILLGVDEPMFGHPSLSPDTGTTPDRHTRSHSPMSDAMHVDLEEALSASAKASEKSPWFPRSPSPSQEFVQTPGSMDLDNEPSPFDFLSNGHNSETSSSVHDHTMSPVAKPLEAEDILDFSSLDDAPHEDGTEVNEKQSQFQVPIMSLDIPETTVNASSVLPLNPSNDIVYNPLLKEPEARSSEHIQSPIAPEEVQDGHHDDEMETDSSIPAYLRPYAVTAVDYDPQAKVKPPLLLRGTLRPYQQAGLEWLAHLHTANLNGILADEMGLGKTIQTIALLAHLACDHGIWGPHLIIVPTSVLLNWEMEFKKFLPGFKVLAYHGNTKRRKELRQGWNNKYHFNVCVTSYTLASRDANAFKRKPWYYMILDEAHMIKNFKSQRWQILLMFRSFRRLLLTGTPLQNNLTELWALLQFLMSGANFANLKEFGDWFSNPLEKAIESGSVLDDENQQRVAKLHTVLRPYLLRRLKREVEKELPSKYEHLVMCPLSKRQRFLYDEFMSRAETRKDLQSGVYQKIANILMQLRKVVNHPDLFEVRPIKTSFAMQRSAISDYEIKELLIRRRLLQTNDEEKISLGLLGLQFIDKQNTPLLVARETRRLDGTPYLPFYHELPQEAPPYDVRTIEGYRKMRAYQERVASISRWYHIAHLNRLRCQSEPIYGSEMIKVVEKMTTPILPLSNLDSRVGYMDTVTSIHSAVKSYCDRALDMAKYVNRFAFATPPVVALDVPSIAFSRYRETLAAKALDVDLDRLFHLSSVKLQIAFPDASLIQYDCGKLQKLADLLRQRKAGGHRVLIFTQMTRVLDILEIFLNFHGYLYLRLDGATKIEDRQYITERFNSDQRVFCFISSSRSGGVGINLTGADTVIFYDSDFNPQMDRQCEDRAHRIGQIRDVHIYRFVSEHTVEEALLRKANQKRALDDIVIQKGEFDWRSLTVDETALTKALGEVEDQEDAHAAVVAANEAVEAEGADNDDFGTEPMTEENNKPLSDLAEPAAPAESTKEDNEEEEEEEEEGGTVFEYMISFIRSNPEFFSNWKC